MSKKWQMLLATAVFATGFTHNGQALFENCTGDVGKKGGPDAYKCVGKVSGKDSNFLSSFIMNHCASVRNGTILTKPKTSQDEYYCQMALQKFGSAAQINDNRFATRQMEQQRKSDLATQKALASSNKSLMKASAKMAPPPYQEEEAMQDYEEDTPQSSNMLSQFSRQLNQLQSKFNSLVRKPKSNQKQVEMDEIEEDDDYGGNGY